MNKSMPALAVGVLLLVGTVTACTSSTPDSPDSGDDLRIAMITGQQGLPFFTSMTCGAQKAADELGVELTVQGPGQFDVAQQQQVINGVLARNPDGILISPTDPSAFNAQLEPLVDDGVGIVALDSGFDHELGLAHVTADGYEGGRLAAEFLGDALNGEGTVLVIANRPGLPISDERENGFIDAVKADYPGISILGPEYAGSDQNKASTIVSAVLQTNPNLTGIYVTLEPAAIGAAAALRSAGRTDVKLVAYDANPQQVQDLRDGIYEALIVQPPADEGEEGMRLLVQYLREGVAPDEYMVHRPLVVATRDNVDSPDVQGAIYSDEC